MKKTYWKIIFTIACLVLAGAAMVSGRSAEAAEEQAEKGSAAEEPMTGNEETQDLTGPVIRLEMKDGSFYDGGYFYRRDNCGISLSVSDEASELAVVEFVINQTVFQLSDFELVSETEYRLVLDAEQVSGLIAQDGAVLISAYAEDAAGNQTVLKETEEDESGTEVHGLALKGEAAEFVLDGTNPKAIITYASAKPFFLYPDQKMVQAYTAERVTATVRYEDNWPLDYGRIRLEQDGVVLEPLADYMADALHQCEFEEGMEHALATYGCDIAGNPLEVTEVIDSAGGSEAGGGQQGKSFEAQEITYDVGVCREPYEPHYRIMIDSSSPVVILTVSGPDGEIYYQVTADGKKTTVERYQPFRQEETAEVRIRYEDLSPARMNYAIGSTLNGQERSVTDPDWNDSGVRVVRESLFGQQTFWLDSLMIADKAGNVLTLGKSNQLYLDVEKPSVTISMPEAVTTATKQITKRNANGQGLYRSDVVLQVSVNDVHMEQTGAGLSQVLCSIKVNGEKIRQDVLLSGEDTSLPDQVVYGEDKMLSDRKYSYQGTITIPKGDEFESNNIEVTVTAIDNAGNQSDPEQGGFVVFGIDSEGPRTEVIYDNQDAQNDSYFKEPRTAEIRIADRNIDSSKIIIETQPEVPEAFAYSEGSDPAGNDDLFSKRVTYKEDGKYTLQISGTDALGNPFRQEVKYRGSAPTSFVIDQTAPKIVFDQVEDGTAYSGKIAPRILFEDVNVSDDLVSLTLTGKRGEDRSDLLPPFTASETGGSYDLQNIEVTAQNDDIYTAVAKMKDLAGNETEQSIEFSVNRFGSTYDYNDDRNTEDFLKAYFSNQEQTLYLREININNLTDYKITLYRDGINQVLKQGTDYRLIQKDYGDARQYIYEIYAGNFKKEGIYDIGVQSVDEAGNTNSNRAVKHKLGTNTSGRSGDNSEVPLRFAIDKTPPQIQVNGMDVRRAQVVSDDQTIRITPYDNMNLRSVQMGLQLSGEEARRQVGTYRGSELFEALDENEGVLPFAFAPKDGQKQTLVVEASDAAGNVYSGNVYYVAPEKSTVFRKGSASPEESAAKHVWIVFIVAGVGAGILTTALKCRGRKRGGNSE